LSGRAINPVADQKTISLELVEPKGIAKVP